VFNATFNNISAMYVNYYCLSMFIYQSNRSDYIAVSYQIVLRFIITLLKIKQQWDWTKSYHNKKYGYTNDNKSSTYINITNLVCYTYFHWFLNPECQHIFGKQTEYIFQSPKTIKTWTTMHYASLNQWYNTE
jgi:hypothetical protein